MSASKGFVSVPRTNLVGPQGQKGDTGAAGAQGQPGQTGATGAQGQPGQPGQAGAAGAAGATGAQGQTGAKGDAGPAGPSGAAGTNATILLGTVTAAESALVTLALAVRRVTLALSGAVVGGSYMATPVSAPPAGYSVQDCYCAAAGQITIGILVPVLSIAGSYSIPIKIFKLN